MTSTPDVWLFMEQFACVLQDDAVALGFTSEGITEGSEAATMMSDAAVDNGGGVAAGSMVAELQSVGRRP